MRFCATATDHGVHIPKPALGLCGISARDEAALHTLGGAGILVKKQMSILEMIRAISGLQRIAEDMLSELSVLCGCCDAQDCAGRMQEDTGYILPPELLRAAKIRPNARVQACTDPETKTVTFRETDREDYLSRIPEKILRQLAERNVCLQALQEILEQEQTEKQEE